MSASIAQTPQPRTGGRGRGSPADTGTRGATSAAAAPRGEADVGDNIVASDVSGATMTRSLRAMSPWRTGLPRSWWASLSPSCLA